MDRDSASLLECHLLLCNELLAYQEGDKHGAQKDISLDATSMFEGTFIKREVTR